ncbi:MAG: ABC transporter permease subunit [Rhodobacteraceae bacterium]|nr:ABC transporter permease subunit [Paracoccaceae bacterium]
MRRLWYDARVRGWAIQAFLLIGVLGAALWIAQNTMMNLEARGIRVGLGFLARPTEFPISESLLPYRTGDSYGWAYVVGVGNTLWISVLAIVFSTLLGLLVALARRSAHPLLSAVAAVYVTLLRNMPLIVQLLFWYAVITTNMPSARRALHPLPGVYLSQRGIYLPSISAAAFCEILIAAAVAGLAMRGVLRHRRVTRGTLPAVGAAVVAGITAVATIAPKPHIPHLVGFNFEGGMALSPEFAALMIGLVLYTSTFIGEIIRGGIDAIARGQWEAARALGLPERELLSRIILPQALRVILPPLGSQYLSTVKNTTLALAVGFPDLALVINTVINQSGQALENLALMIAIYLSISLAISALINWYNAHVAIVVR